MNAIAINLPLWSQKQVSFHHTLSAVELHSEMNNLLSVACQIISPE
jgi:hypothetical protein